MKKVTITLPEDLARWLRIKAAKDDLSVSRWLAELLEGMRRQEDQYETAMKQGQGVVFAVDPGADPITSEDVYRSSGDWP